MFCRVVTRNIGVFTCFGCSAGVLVLTRRRNSSISKGAPVTGVWPAALGSADGNAIPYHGQLREVREKLIPCATRIVVGSIYPGFPAQ